jgi:hypothetical protein
VQNFKTLLCCVGIWAGICDFSEIAAIILYFQAFLSVKAETIVEQKGAFADKGYERSNGQLNFGDCNHEKMCCFNRYIACGGPGRRNGSGRKEEGQR